MTEVRKTQKEQLEEFLQEIWQELNFVVCPSNLQVELVRNLSVKPIEIQMKKEKRDVREELISAYKVINQIDAGNNPAAFYQALCVFDIGLFAYALSYQFDLIASITKEIWRERKVFSPNLSDAAYAAFCFVCHLRRGKGPKRSFRHALRELNTVYRISEIYSVKSVYGNKPIGHVLNSAALSRLKELLRAYALEHRDLW
jgi:cytochrome c553